MTKAQSKARQFIKEMLHAQNYRLRKPQFEKLLGKRAVQKALKTYLSIFKGEK